MKTNWLKITVAVAAIVSLGGIAQATPITGNIGFSGGAQMNTDNANTAAEVIGWITPVVSTAPSGSFTGLSGAVTMNSPWTFNPSTPLAAFWSIGGFTFNLVSSTIIFDASGHLDIDVYGNVVSTNPSFSQTAFSGSFDIANPNDGHAQEFSARLSFEPVPDGGTTVMLLGLGLLSLALFRKKMFA
ncbi:MAG TPA: VPDSG-CTERM sorting domain-containing protein [Verrucomicrobiae bacterium]